MSITTDICCLTCKESIWIGQGDIIYYGEKETMKKLNAFLQKHRTKLSYEPDELFHKLVFVGDNTGIMMEDGWSRIK